MDPNYVQLITLLIGLGITTAEKIRAFLRSDESMDDATIDAIMSDVDARLARRG